jgi:hypothetical protein
VKKTYLQYRGLESFDVLEIGEVKTLITKGETVRYFMPAKEIFNVIESAHVAIGHGGQDRLKKEVSRKYANAMTKMINIFYRCVKRANKRKVRRGQAWF